MADHPTATAEWHEPDGTVVSVRVDVPRRNGRTDTPPSLAVAVLVTATPVLVIQDVMGRPPDEVYTDRPRPITDDPPMSEDEYPHGLPFPLPPGWDYLDDMLYCPCGYGVEPDGCCPDGHESPFVTNGYI